VTFILKFGGDLSGKFWRWLGTETTRLDLKRPSRLNGGDSQVYDGGGDGSGGDDSGGDGSGGDDSGGDGSGGDDSDGDIGYV